MKRAAVVILTLLSLAASGCASASTRATDSALVQHDTPASATPVVANCLLKQQTRPSSFVLTCADAGDVLSGLHWVSWGATAAFAAAVEQVNDCTPNCASGKFIDYPALVALWRPEPLPGHPGVRYFTRVTRIYTANRPPLYDCTGTRTCYPQSNTTDLWS
jgi:hypothetical protein